MSARQSIQPVHTFSQAYCHKENAGTGINRKDLVMVALNLNSPANGLNLTGKVELLIRPVRPRSCIFSTRGIVSGLTIARFLRTEAPMGNNTNSAKVKTTRRTTVLFNIKSFYTFTNYKSTSFTLKGQIF